ncbi:MAG: acyl transferase [Ferruginibacter sp.]|nr:acyl transferase [Ferruginibacter sp.]
MNTFLPATLQNIILNTTEENFVENALQVFNFQYEHNEVYRSYCDILKIDSKNISTIENIPYLPIQFFKNKIIKTTHFETDTVFESSGTTGSINSKHFIKDVSLYEESFMHSFRQFYDDEKDYCIIGLLPSYLERKGSSLVHMVNDLIQKSGNKESGFYLYDYKKLKDVLLKNEAAKQQTLLIGVTYALLDFAEQNDMQLNHTIVMETGGMKGRREEMTRKEVHSLLMKKFGLNVIHSEYGMTELLSQAYSKGNGIFYCPPWMKVLVRSEDDPFNITSAKNVKDDYATGAINIIDLANLYSCSFIATDDAGKLFANNSFEITGRLENSDIRGCSLMVI